MKLNLDCFNAILFYLQTKITVNDKGQMNSIYIDQLVQDMSDKFSRGDIFYCISNLSETKYIKADTYRNENSRINDITYLGHQYLNSLQS